MLATTKAVIGFWPYPSSLVDRYAEGLDYPDCHNAVEDDAAEQEGEEEGDGVPFVEGAFLLFENQKELSVV